MVHDPAQSFTESGGGSSAAGASAGYGLLDDVPPSYDSIATSSVAGGSSEAGGSPSWPASMDALFTGPPHAETLITRDGMSRLDQIETHKVSNHIESWDRKLSDPETLYNFLREQTLVPPSVVIRCKAFHMETAQRQQTIMQEGNATQVTTGQRYAVTDFDFTIDLSEMFAHSENNANVVLMATRAHVPTLRGTHTWTFGAGTRAGRDCTNDEIKRWTAWRKYRAERGLAPWADMAGDNEFWASYSGNPDGGIALGSSRPDDEEALIGDGGFGGNASLKEWCQAYCADQGLLKSFVFNKGVWGWDMAKLKIAIERAIMSTGYRSSDGSQLTIDIQGSSDAVLVVRPNNLLVRMVHSPFWFGLLCITLIYPFIWVWQRVHHRGGAPYEVASATYGMKVYPPLPGTYAGEQVDAARDRLPGLFKLHPELPRSRPFLHAGPKGVHYLLGRREGEWFREWEERIRMAVRTCFKGALTNTRVDGDEEPPELDGYEA